MKEEKKSMEDSYVLHLPAAGFEEFHLAFCGYARCRPSHSYGPATRPNYIIHFILEGKGCYQVDGRKYYLSAGQGFLIEPDTLTFYRADKEAPWSYLWIGVGGTKAESYLRDIGLNHRQLIFQCGQGERLKRIILEMLRHTEASVSNQYYLQARLYDFISVLTEDLVVDACMEDSRESGYIKAAVSYIRNHYAEGLYVEDIAQYINVNRSYLYTLFVNSLGIAPKDYLTKFRISKACEQLILTDSSIEGIAEACGYHNPLVFSKAFKRETGITPTEYRKKNRNEAKQHLQASQDELEGIGRDVFVGREEDRKKR